MGLIKHADNVSGFTWRRDEIESSIVQSLWIFISVCKTRCNYQANAPYLLVFKVASILRWFESLIKLIKRARHGRLWGQRSTSSKAKTLVFAISMSVPASGLISKVSPRSRNNIPRRLTLTAPIPSWTTTSCPIHVSNALLTLPQVLSLGRQHG